MGIYKMLHWSRENTLRGGDLKGLTPVVRQRLENASQARHPRQRSVPRH